MRTLSLHVFAALLLGLPNLAAAIPEGPAPNTPAWVQREAANYAKTTEAPTEQLAPAFMQRLLTQSAANEQQWLLRGISSPDWFIPTSGNTNVTPLCTSWMAQCVGDPFRYPATDSFYTNEAEVSPFVIYDDGCARLSGRVWAPKGSRAGDGLPNVVIETGSIQAPEPLYWWMAQALVRQGYVVLSFDVRGQGRSDEQTPTGGQGSNVDSTVFWTDFVNVIDFFRSSAVAPYPHNKTCAGTYDTPVTAFNPFNDRMDPDRLGIAGHSLGATGVSVVQSYDGAGADAWPGKLDKTNPVKVIVAWDGLVAPHASSSSAPAVVARVPAMGHSSEYGIGGTPFTAPPDPERKKAAYIAWRNAGLPVYQLSIQGSTHFEWSPIPTFPSTSWCPSVVDNHCVGGWGRPMGEHYSLAWFDRWLKKPGEKGYHDADSRLLADADWHERYSFYDRSARAFLSRDGAMQLCEDIRAGCPKADAPVTPTAPTSPPDSSAPATASSGSPRASPVPKSSVASTQPVSRYSGGALEGSLLAGLLLLAGAKRRQRR